MTREELEEFLYMGCESTNVVSQKCMNMKSCRKCIQEELAEYEKQIRADVFKDCILENGKYCWQRCVAIEHCQECKCLGNGEINYFS